MSGSLYTLEVLRLAAQSGAIARLKAPHLTGARRSQLCGSSVTIDLELDNDVVTRVGGEVRACAFGQASALLLTRSAVGRTLAEIEAARGEIACWLTESEAPAPSWPGVEALKPARAKAARHAAILLPFDAALAAARAET